MGLIQLYFREMREKGVFFGEIRLKASGSEYILWHFFIVTVFRKEHGPLPLNFLPELL